MCFCLARVIVIGTRDYLNVSTSVFFKVSTLCRYALAMSLNPLTI